MKTHLKLLIDSNDLTHLDKITKLVREGWYIIGIFPSDEEVGTNTKVVFLREI